MTPKLPKKRTVKSEVIRILKEISTSPAATFYKGMTGRLGRKLEDWEIMERQVKARSKKFNK